MTQKDVDECECEFEPDLDDPYEDGTPGNESWHFRRKCEHCGRVWWSLHCRHDGRQNPCHWCEKISREKNPA